MITKDWGLSSVDISTNRENYERYEQTCLQNATLENAALLFQLWCFFIVVDSSWPATLFTIFLQTFPNISTGHELIPILILNFILIKCLELCATSPPLAWSQTGRCRCLWTLHSPSLCENVHLYFSNISGNKKCSLSLIISIIIWLLHHNDQRIQW